MKYLNYLKKYKFIILPILVFILITFYIFFNLFETEAIEEDVLETNEITQTNIIEESKKTIKIDIKGAVKKPGVYELENNSRVSDAISLSGGLTSSADTSLINLSKVLNDEMVIIIYTKKEVENMKKGEVTTIYIEKDCVCPKEENDACIEGNDANIETSNNTEKTSKVSINTATLEELMTISGIGESKAKAIIEYREQNNGFKSIEEIKNVSGIGESLYEKIKDSIII